MTPEQIAEKIHEWVEAVTPLPPDYKVRVAVQHDVGLETRYARPLPIQFGKTDRRVVARRFRVSVGISLPPGASVDSEELADAVAAWYDGQAHGDRTLGGRVRDVVLTVGEFEPVARVAGTIRTMRATAYEVETHEVPN